MAFFLQKLIDDTLKDKKGKWSRTSLTMASAWWASLTIFIWDFCLNGFNEVAFCTIVGVALGSKVTDAWSKKLDPEIIAPTINNEPIN